MNCPACSKTLSEKKLSDLTVDVCDQGCAGIWLDNFEINKIDEAHESAGETLLNISAPLPATSQPGAKRSCPKCQNVKMFAHFFTVREQVEVDSCGGCGGVWLDTRELAAIRKEFTTEADRKQAFEDYFQKMFQNDLDLAKAKREQQSEKIKKITSALRYILPSYYIPGKQPWGAY